MTEAQELFASYADTVRHNEDAWLGVLCWYTVEEAVRVEHDRMLELLTEEGLDQFAPPIPRDDDVFRRACTNAQRKRIPVANSDKYENHLVRDVTKAGGHVWKHVVVETVDANNKRLKLEPVIEVAFNPDSGIIETNELRKRVSDSAWETANQIRREYLAWRGMVHAYTVRSLLRSLINQTGAVTVRPSGGIYFVMRDKLDLIEAAERLGEKIAGVSFHVLPLVDDGKQRDMLRAAFEAETTGEIDKILGEIDELMTGPPVTTKRFAQFAKRREELAAKTAGYGRLLEDSLNGVDLRLRALEANTKRLFKHTKG